jgi:hypothetical protein
MINLSTLTFQDLGKRVVYTPQAGRRETGYIVSFNHQFAFVEYPPSEQPKATLPEDLEWDAGAPLPPLDTADAASIACPHCHAVFSVPGLSTVFATVCPHCSQGIDVKAHGA